MTPAIVHNYLIVLSEYLNLFQRDFENTYLLVLLHC